MLLTLIVLHVDMGFDWTPIRVVRDCRISAQAQHVDASLMTEQGYFTNGASKFDAACFRKCFLNIASVYIYIHIAILYHCYSTFSDLIPIYVISTNNELKVN